MTIALLIVVSIIGLVKTNAQETITEKDIAAGAENQEYEIPLQLPDETGRLLNDVSSGGPNNKILSNILNFPPSSTNNLYTRNNANTPQILRINDEASIQNSNFKKGVTTYVVIHGYLGEGNNAMNQVIKQELLNAYDANVIILDWSDLSSASYLTAVVGAQISGRQLGAFLTFLSQVTREDIGNFYLIGHSLGAHLAGYAGRFLGGRVGRITALDPAGPLWALNPNALVNTDAQYVEAIHTDGLGYGLLQTVGHTDFYVNGGEVQPGCFLNTCSHARSWQIFAVSLSHDFIGYRCNSVSNALINACSGNQLVMGDGDVKKRGLGVYRVNTSSNYPFY